MRATESENPDRPMPGPPVEAPRATARAVDPAVDRTRRILAQAFGPTADRRLAVRFWDGSLENPPGDGAARCTLVLRHPGALRRMLLPPTQLALGEAYLRDDFDIEGDAEAAASLADPLAARLRSPAARLRLLRSLLALPATSPGAKVPAGFRSRRGRHSRRRDAAAVRFHYDVGNEFFALWLDRQMVYSCAYFVTGDETLDAAQEAKLDLICRKLRLQPGERLLDIGCGWGALVLHAAAHYGVEATGITLSAPQAVLAHERIAAAGLGDRCRVEVRDYRDLPARARFDKIASIGMVEHVGKSRLRTYFGEVLGHLAPAGLFLNHGIVSLDRGSPFQRALGRVHRRWTSFLERYVFPDSELLAPGEVIASAEAVGLETRDLESLREHYALTLRHWVRRLEARHEEAAALAGERIYRIWRLYMAGSAHAFASGRIGVVQTLFAHRDSDGRVDLPLSRYPRQGERSCPERHIGGTGTE